MFSSTDTRPRLYVGAKALARNFLSSVPDSYPVAIYMFWLREDWIIGRIKTRGVSREGYPDSLKASTCHANRVMSCYLVFVSYSDSNVIFLPPCKIKLVQIR